MELIRHAKSVSEYLNSIIVLIISYFVFAIVLLAYIFFLSHSNDQVFNTMRQISFQPLNMEQIRQESETMALPPPPPKQDQTTDIENAVLVDTIIEKEKLAENDNSYNNSIIEPDTNLIAQVISNGEGENGDGGAYDGDGTGAGGGNIFMIAEIMPQFPGGEFALRRYIAENIKYPLIARTKKIEGKVYIKFCVTSIGTIDKVTVARGVDQVLDEEAIRVVQALPRWTPGEQRGRKVNVWYTVPIDFRLN